MDVVDPDLDAVQVTKAPDKVRRAWWTSEERSAELGRLLEALGAGAALLGVRKLDDATVCSR